MVHRGELVGTPLVGDTFSPTIQVTINAGGSDAEYIGQYTARAIETTVRRLQQNSRYRGNRFV